MCLVCLFRFSIVCVFVLAYIIYLILFLCSLLLVLGLVSSVQSQESGLGECLRNDIFSVEWDVKP